MERPAGVPINPALIVPACTPAVELVTVTLKVHDPLAGMVNDVEVPELDPPGAANGVTPAQVDVAAGVGAFTNAGK